MSLKKGKSKSEFQESLGRALKVQRDKELPEDKRKEIRYNKLNAIFTELGDRQNRYIFYCPDIPFALSTVKIIYETVNKLKQLGYNAMVLHEVKGYRPSWLKKDWVKDIPTDYLQHKTAQGTLTKPVFKFKPTDTIIIPDGFFSIMKGFENIKQIHKVVFAFGYGGFATAEIDWSFLGFTDVLCVSEKIKEDYSKTWPHLNYHVIGYEINQEDFAPVEPKNVYPVIALSCRNREDAGKIITIFQSKYPYLDMFSFKILKKLDTEQYAEALKNSALLVFVDEQAGHPAPPLEAIAAGVPTIAVYGRGMEHLANHPGILWVEANDPFLITELLAKVCINWLSNPTVQVTDKTILNNYTSECIKTNLLNTFEELQLHKIKLFTAVKKAVDEGKLDDTVFAEQESKSVVQTTNAEV
jgi:hypothetical protein